MTLIRLLIVDDELPPAPAPSPERETLLEECNLQEVSVGTAATSPLPSENLMIEAAFTTGANEQGRFTFERIREAVTSGVGPEGWALILLDVTFGRERHFGEHVRHRLRDEFPGIPVILLTARGEYELETPGVPYLSKEGLAERELVLELLKYGQLTTEQRRALLQIENEVAVSPAMLDVLRQAFRFAATGARVLLLGDTGVGKEIVARYIHRLSSRSAGLFVGENMASFGASDPSLLHVLLFGRRPGYLGRDDEGATGLFELAAGGTLFLDEVDQLPAQTQSTLLRVLQEERYRRLGDEHETETDIRLLTATSRDIERLVREGTFREDLLYRIRGVTLRIPPLRERPEDITPLAEWFLTRKMEELGLKGVKWSKEARQLLRELPLPGNARQLDNLIQRILLEKGNNALISEQDVWTAAEVERATQPPDVEDSTGTGERSSTPVLTLANLPEQLAALPISKNDPEIDGILRRLDTAVAQLKKRLAGAALKRSWDPGAPEPDRTRAVRRLLHDPDDPDYAGSITSSQAHRLLLSILGEKQANRMTPEQIQALLDAWESGPPNGAPPEDETPSDNPYTR